MPTLSERQLAAWEEIADGWLSEIDADGVRRCGTCGKGIMLEIDSCGRAFRYTHEDVLALTVLHLRNHHADLDPDQ